MTKAKPKPQRDESKPLTPEERRWELCKKLRRRGYPSAAEEIVHLASEIARLEEQLKAAHERLNRRERSGLQTSRNTT
jgi:hypothetical protein